MKDADVKNCGQNGRNFIKAIIELASADVSATIQEKEFTNDETPLTEKERYVKDGMLVFDRLFFPYNNENISLFSLLGLIGPHF